MCFFSCADIYKYHLVCKSYVWRAKKYQKKYIEFIIIQSKWVFFIRKWSVYSAKTDVNNPRIQTTANEDLIFIENQRMV